MAAPSYQNSTPTPLAVVAFDPTAGLTLSSATGEEELISSTAIICLLSNHQFGLFTLLHLRGLELCQTPISHATSALLGDYLYCGIPNHLATALCDITVLISVRSGGGTAEAFFNGSLSPLLQLLGIGAEIVRTTSDTSIAETIEALSAKQRAQTVLLLSGDTGIHEAINAYRPSGSANSLSLAVFPLGTGNALASSLHTSRDICPLAALLFGKPHKLPTFTATFSPGSKWCTSDREVPASGVKGAVVASWGFHASLVADAEILRGEGVGVERFKTAAAKNLNPPHAYQGTLSILPPGSGAAWRKIVRDEHFYALATMCSNLEEAFRISPGSRLGEQVIRVVHFAPMPPNEVMAVMGGAYHGGTHVDDERVGYEVAKGVRIEVDENEQKWRRICVDGNTVILPKGGWVEVKVGTDSSKVVEVIWRG